MQVSFLDSIFMSVYRDKRKESIRLVHIEAGKRNFQSRSCRLENLVFTLLIFFFFVLSDRRHWRHGNTAAKSVEIGIFSWQSCARINIYGASGGESRNKKPETRKRRKKKEERRRKTTSTPVRIDPTIERKLSSTAQ